MAASILSIQGTQTSLYNYHKISVPKSVIPYLALCRPVGGFLTWASGNMAASLPYILATQASLFNYQKYLYFMTIPISIITYLALCLPVGDFLTWTWASGNMAASLSSILAAPDSPLNHHKISGLLNYT